MARQKKERLLDTCLGKNKKKQSSPWPLLPSLSTPPDRCCAISASLLPSRTRLRQFCGGGVPGFAPPWLILAMAAVVRSKNAFGFLRRRRRTHHVSTARRFSHRNRIGRTLGTLGEGSGTREGFPGTWSRHPRGRRLRQRKRTAARFTVINGWDCSPSIAKILAKP